MIPLHDDNPTEITPVVTVTFIVLCSVVFLYEISLPAQASEVFVYMYGAIPAVVLGNAQLPSRAHEFAGLWNPDIQYVSPWGMDAFVGKHVVSLDFWEQY